MKSIHITSTMSNNINILDLNADVFLTIFKNLDSKSIKNLLYSTSKFRFSTNKRIVDIFMDHIIYTIPNNVDLKTINNKFLINIKKAVICFDNENLHLIMPNISALYILNLNIKFNKLQYLTKLEFGIGFNKNLGNSLYGLQLTHLKFNVYFNKKLHYYDKVINKKVSCLEGLPLKYLYFTEFYTKNISNNLKGLPLEELYLGKVDYLLNNKLKGLPLKKLYIFYLSKSLNNSLKDLPLEYLDIRECIKNLFYVKNNKYFSCLEGLPLKIFKIKYCNPFSYIDSDNKMKSIFHGLPLEEIYINSCEYLLYNSLNNLVSLKILELNENFIGKMYYIKNGIIHSFFKGLSLEKLIMNYHHSIFEYDNNYRNISLGGLSVKYLKINKFYGYHYINNYFIKTLEELSLKCLDLSECSEINEKDIIYHILIELNKCMYNKKIILDKIILPYNYSEEISLGKLNFQENNYNFFNKLINNPISIISEIYINRYFKNIVKKHDKEGNIVDYTYFDVYELKYINMYISKKLVKYILISFLTLIIILFIILYIILFI